MPSGCLAKSVGQRALLATCAICSTGPACVLTHKHAGMWYAPCQAAGRVLSYQSAMKAGVALLWRWMLTAVGQDA